MFDTMGLSGNLLIVSSGDSIWIFAVPKNLILLKQNYEVLAKNIVKLKYRLKTGKL